jgi:hypothetical protein
MDAFPLVVGIAERGLRFLCRLSIHEPNTPGLLPTVPAVMRALTNHPGAGLHRSHGIALLCQLARARDGAEQVWFAGMDYS